MPLFDSRIVSQARLLAGCLFIPLGPIRATETIVADSDSPGRLMATRRKGARTYLPSASVLLASLCFCGPCRTRSVSDARCRTRGNGYWFWNSPPATQLPSLRAERLKPPLTEAKLPLAALL